MLMDVVQLKPGMMANENIILPGTKIILLTKGSKINERAIASLKKWNIKNVDIMEQAEDQAAPQEKSQDIEMLKSISRVEGDTLVLTGDVKVTGHAIESAHSVKVEGSVLEGTVISSEKDIIVTGKVIGGSLYCTGNVLIMNGIEGRVKSIIESDGDIKVAFLRDCRVHSKKGSIYVDYNIVNSFVRARKNLAVGIQKGLLQLNDEFKQLKKGAVQSGVIMVGEELDTLDLGNEKQEKLEIRVVNYDMMNIGNELLRIEDELRRNLSEYKEIEKTISLIKTLGRNIVSLTEGKKLELKQQSDRYFKLKNDIVELNRTRVQLLKEKEETTNRLKDYAYIKVYEKVYPGVNISIDQMQLQIRYSQKKVAFLKRGMIIMAKLEEELV